MRIGLISDTHGHLDPKLFSFLEECDEIWHAGDIGSLALAEKLREFRPLKAVWGNIDGPEIRYEYPEVQRFECQGLQVLMIHIGGFPGRYAPGIRNLLKKEKPDLFICGHSHIVRAMPDEKLGLIHLNPGACGRQGIHLEKTIMRFSIENGEMSRFQICRLGAR
ncbi:MAG: metallophosphoesterase family protein [Vulcanimicrobiota bacterium]